MSGLEAFAQALKDPAAPPPPQLAVLNFCDPFARFNVHRNNVVVSLVDALCEGRPVCLQLVGADFFRAMARVYAQTTLPSSPLLWRYGDTFADFIDGFAPVADIPYLADVARLECARLHAFHAPDAIALGTADFAALDPSNLEGLRIALHPAVRTVRSRYAIVSLWAAHEGVVAFEGVDPLSCEDALIARPDCEVETTRLRAGQADFFLSLSLGRTLGEAAACAMQAYSGFDLAHAIHVLIATGAAHSFTCRSGDCQ